MNPLQDILSIVNRMRLVLALLFGAIVVGTYGYHFIEKWSIFDGLYMTVITLGTIGYGETHPLSETGKAFTMVLILVGVSVVTYAFTTLTSILVEGTLSEALKRRRMESDIAKLSAHYIVCGAGHAGAVVVEELRKTGRVVVVVERDKAIAEKLIAEGLFVIPGDATEDETLKRAGVERAAGVFAVLSSDQNNAFVALTAKGLNPRVRVVSAQKELGVREKLIRSGADHVVNPEFIGGLRMASEMIRPATVGFLDSMIRERGSVIRFDEINVPEGSPYVGRPVGSVKGAEGNGPLLVAVHDTVSGKYEINPETSRPIRAGEKLVMLGDVLKLSELRKKIETA